MGFDLGQKIGDTLTNPLGSAADTYDQFSNEARKVSPGLGDLTDLYRNMSPEYAIATGRDIGKAYENGAKFAAPIVVGLLAAPATGGLSIAQGMMAGAAVGATGSAINNENILEGAAKGAVIGGVSAGIPNVAPASVTSPTAQGMINQGARGMIAGGLNASMNDQDVGNGMFVGGASGAGGAAAGQYAYDNTGSKNIAKVASSVGGNVAGMVAKENLPNSIPDKPIPESQYHKAAMDQITKGYTPSVQEGINPLLLASVSMGDTPNGSYDQTYANGITPIGNTQRNGVVSLTGA